MQTASSTLAAAITSRERQPVATLKVDWLRNGSYSWDPGVFRDVYSDTYEGVGDFGDLTPFLESASVDKSLATDLPDAAKIDSGYGAAAGSAVLAGRFGGLPIEQVFTAHGNPLTTLAPRIGTPVRLELGMRTSAGVETLRALTGTIRNSHVDPSSGSVTLDLLDFRDRLRTPVTFPVLVADDLASTRPGLWAQWLIDVIARANGFYASPPVRSSAFLSATLHGSATAEIGTLTSAAGLTATSTVAGQAAFASHPGGPMGLSGSTSLQSQAIYALTAGLNTNNGSNLYAEMTVTTSAVDQLVFVNSGSAAWQVRFRFVNGTLGVTVTRNSVASAEVVVALSPLDGTAAHSLGVHVAFTATGFNVNARCDGVTGSGVGTVANSTGSPSLTAASIQGGLSGAVLSALQITSESFSAGMFNNGFVPTAAFEQSFNNLTATPSVDSSDPWTLLQQLADAEQGIVLFDEAGLLRFYNRNHLAGGAAVGIITTDPSVAQPTLKALTSDETGDSIRNYVTVGATPHTLDPPGTILWSLTEVLGIIRFGHIAVSAELPAPTLLISAVQYLASTTADNTGANVANLIVTVTKVSGLTYVIDVTNPNPFDVFLVGPSTSGTAAGQPNLSVLGRSVRVSENGYSAARPDLGSASLYGTQTLDVAENPFRQSSTSADGLADFLLSALREPHPTLTGMAIVGDPRLQLADRVRVTEPEGLGLDEDQWVIGLQTTFSVSEGLAQTATVRQA